MNIADHGAGGVRHISHMHRSAGQFPDQPRIDCAESQIAGFGQLQSTGNVLQHPRDLGSGEIRIDHEPGSFAEVGRSFALLQTITKPGGTTILPDDRIMNRLPGPTIPQHGRFTLICDPDSSDIGRGNFCLPERSFGNGQLSRPDLLRIVFDPARLRKELSKLLLSNGQN